MLIMDLPLVGTNYFIPYVFRSTVLKEYQAMIKFMADDLKAEKVILMGYSLRTALSGDALWELNLKEIYPKCQVVAVIDRSFSTFPEEATCFIGKLGETKIAKNVTTLAQSLILLSG